jgi:hypothetical protein
MKRFAILCAAVLVALPAVKAQAPLSCDHQNRNSYCEIREIALSSTGSPAVSLDINTGGVGAISVQGWDNPWVFVRAAVNTSADDSWQARQIAQSVAIDTSSNRIWASGPFGKSWAVAYQVFVPHASALELNTRVGAVTISDVTGTIHFTVGVGAVALSGLAGEIEGKTGVGAIALTLSGDHWDGKGIHVETGTGAIRIHASADYSAAFDLRTVLGAIVTDFPGARPTAAGFLGRRLAFDAGAGGALIYAATSVGEVDLNH